MQKKCMKELKLKIQSDFDQKILHWFTTIVNTDKNLNHK